MNSLWTYYAASAAVLFSSWSGAAEYSVRKVGSDLSKAPSASAKYWKDVPELNVSLMAQMIVKPKPAKAETEAVKVQIVHDGKTVAYRLRWRDKEKSEAGRGDEFSDAVALQFPVPGGAGLPPIFMGGPGNPVHIFHWRAQYQYDEEHGKKSVKDLYPNMTVDTYPNEFPDRGNLKPATQEEMETFSPAVMAGNPQSRRKKAVDEMLAEGFGTSVVTPGGHSAGRGEWADGEWTVVITRALECKGGSVLAPGQASAFGLAVWQGGAGEVGARKALTMAWTPFRIEEK